MANGSLLHVDYLKKERTHLVLSDRETTDMVWHTVYSTEVYNLDYHACGTGMFSAETTSEDVLCQFCTSH